MSQQSAVPHVFGKELILVGLLGALGVAVGAFSAHGLEKYLAESMGLFEPTLSRRVAQAETGVRYHLIHVVALLGLVAVAPQFGRPGQRRTAKIAFWLITVGIVLFSGSLYLLVALNLPILGAVTPFGGVSLIAGWIAMAALGIGRGRTST